MRYMCRRKEQKRTFLLSPLIERLQIKVRENTKIFAVVKCTWGGHQVSSVLLCPKSTHYRGKAVFEEQQIYFGFALRAETQDVEGNGFGAFFKPTASQIVRVLNCCYHYSD